MTKVQTSASWETKSPLSIPGIILSDIGLEPFIDKLQELLPPLRGGLLSWAWQLLGWSSLFHREIPRRWVGEPMNDKCGDIYGKSLDTGYTLR